MTIQVKIKQVYGKDTIYPVCEKAKLFADMANQKTLTDKEVNLIKQLGYSIAVVQEAVSL